MKKFHVFQYDLLNKCYYLLATFKTSEDAQTFAKLYKKGNDKPGVEYIACQEL